MKITRAFKSPFASSAEQKIESMKICHQVVYLGFNLFCYRRYQTYRYLTAIQLVLVLDNPNCFPVTHKAFIE